MHVWRVNVSPDVSDVIVDGARAEVQLWPEFARMPASREQTQNLQLAWSEGL